MSSGALSEPLFVARAGSVRPLDASAALWRARQGPAAHALTHAEAVLVQCAQAFGTRDEILGLATQKGRMPREAAERALAHLLELGVVAELGDLLPGPRDEAPAPPPLVAIRTCDRPEALVRLLDSIVAHAGAGAATRGFVVLDDSLDPRSQGLARSAVEAFAARAPVPVRYFGAEASAALAAELGRLKPDQREVISSLLDPASRGPVATGSRTWNLAILLSAGGMVSLLDDDTLFPLRAPGGSGSRFEFSQTPEQETRALDDPRELLELPRVPGDPFAYAGRFVGRSPGTLLARDGWLPDSARGRGVGAVSHLRPGTRVVAAFSGSYGGIPYNSTMYFSTGSQAQLDHLLRAPYRHARLEGDDTWQGTLNPRIVPRAVYTPLLLDNRSLRPFAGSLGKEDDTLFLHLTKAIDPDALFVFLPAAIGHYPVEKRGRLERSLQPAISDTNNFLVACVNDVLALLRSEDPAQRLAFLGANFEELAHASEARLVDAVLGWRDTLFGGLVGRLSQVLAERRDAPEEWRRHAERMLEANRAALLERALDPSYVAHLRTALRQAAAAARFWPELWGYCAARSAGG